MIVIGKVNLEEVINLNYSKSGIEKLMSMEQEHIQLDTLKLVKETCEIISINLDVGSKYADEPEEKWDIYFTYTKCDKTYKLEEDKVYITDLGILIYDTNYAQWALYYFKAYKEKYICKNLLDYFKQKYKE